MSQNFDDWAARLVSSEIPVMRSTLQAVKALQANSDVSAARIAAAIMPDPMMTLKLLRLANANKRGEFAQRIATAEHAVMMLGLNATFTRLQETLTLEETMPVAAQSGLLRCVARACHAATHAREWAVQRLDTSSEEVYIAALLQEIAEMALWVADADQMQLLEKARRKQEFNEAEIQIFGFQLKALANALAEQWNMPPLVAAAMLTETREIPVRPRCVALANRLSRDAEWGWYGEALAKDIEEIAEARRLPLDEVAAQIYRTSAEVARRRVFAGVQPAAAWLPMLPGEWPEEDEPQKFEALPVADPFQSAMNEIARHLDGTLTLHDLLLLVVRGMRDGVGLERVVFALLTSDRGTLAAKYVVGATEDSPLKAFRFDMGSRHLLSMLMAKPQAIWMTEANRAKYAGYLNEDIARITSGHEFHAMSLSVHGKVIGLFYVDRAGRPLDADSYEKFKKLCGQAATCMEHLAKSKPATA